MKFQLKRAPAFFLIFLFLLPILSHATEQTPVEPVIEVSEADFVASPISSALQMILALLCVVALAYLVLNKGLGAILKRQRTGHVIKVRERVPLDAKHSLFLVEINENLLVLSTSEKGVEIIIPSLSIPQSNAEPSPSSSFAALLKKATVGA